MASANNKHTIDELHQWQQLPLDLKIAMTRDRIREWIKEYGEDGVYVSFSGGKDSTVLLDLVRNVCGYDRVPAVFVDTGLEYPEIRDFVKTFDNVTWLKPKLTFKQTIEKYGYPFISKEVSECVYGARQYLTRLLQEMDNPDRQTDRQTDRLPYAQFYRKVCGIGEYSSHRKIVEGGCDNKFRRLYGLGLYSKSIGGQEAWARWLNSTSSNNDGDAHKQTDDSEKGEYP